MKDTGTDTKNAVKAILDDDPQPYTSHYHDLPSRRINLSEIALHIRFLETEYESLRKQRNEMALRMFLAEQALGTIALNHAEAARSGVCNALNALNGTIPNREVSK